MFTWRTLWLGKWHKTSYKCSEEFIRMQHPEAIKVEGTREVRRLPSTEVEVRASMGAGAFMYPPNAKNPR